MRIVIIGAGDVGFMLAKQLSYEGHDISLVEVDKARFNAVRERVDVQAVQGSGTSSSIQEQAGVRAADMLLAVTTNDEVNLVAALMAKKYGVERTIVRVKNRELLREDAVLGAAELDIDLYIHPESEAAGAATRLLKQTAATDIIEFEDGRIVLAGIQVADACPIMRIPLVELAQSHAVDSFRIVAIQRKDITRIPTGSDSIQPDDRIFVFSKREALKDALKIFGKENAEIENVMILGGGQIGFLLANELQSTYNVKILESGKERSYKLAERLEKSLVIHGDGLDINLLALEGITDMDAFIAVTGDDETNIISCLMARHLQVARIISLANKPDFVPILPTIGIDAYISKQKLTADAILKYIRRGDIVSVASIPGIAAEVIEFIPKTGAKITRKPLAKLSLPKNAILGAVLRNGEVITPVGETLIQAGDRVVLFALPSAIRDIEKLFS